MNTGGGGVNNVDFYNYNTSDVFDEGNHTKLSFSLLQV